MAGKKKANKSIFFSFGFMKMEKREYMKIYK